MSLRIFVPSAAELLTDHRGHGEGLIAWKLLDGLAERGHSIVACAREVDVRGEPAFDVVELGRGRLQSVEPLRQARIVAREFDRRGGVQAFDVAHWIFPPDFDEIAFAAAGELPFVYGPHSLAWGQASARRARRAGDFGRAVVRPVLRRRCRVSLGRARLLLHSVPEAAAELPVDAGGRARLLPFGVDPGPRQPAPLPAQPSILVVGRLEPSKGTALVLRALVHLPSSVRLVVAGEGSEGQSLERLAAAVGVADRVTWLGSVPHERVPGLIRDSSLLCSTAIGEPFGMTVLEAMAEGRAVVAIDAGGPRFLIDREGGELVWPASPERLAEVLAELVLDRDRLERMGRHNRARVDREFAWDRVLDRLEELYAEALGSPPGAVSPGRLGGGVRR